MSAFHPNSPLLPVFIHCFAFNHCYKSVAFLHTVAFVLSPSPRPQLVSADSYPSLVLPAETEIFLPTLAKCFLTGGCLIILDVCMLYYCRVCLK